MPRRDTSATATPRPPLSLTPIPRENIGTVVEWLAEIEQEYPVGIVSPAAPEPDIECCPRFTWGDGTHEPTCRQAKVVELARVDADHAPPAREPELGVVVADPMLTGGEAAPRADLAAGAVAPVVRAAEVHEPSIAEKVEYVKRQPQTRSHHCHWPGCDAQVPPARWGCYPHWMKLPADIRQRIWDAYLPRQEVTMTPSETYVEAARAAQD